MSSLVNQTKDLAAGLLDKFFAPADRNPKIRIAYDIGLIAIGMSAIILGLYLGGGLSGGAPSLSQQTMMPMAIGLLATGVGLAWLAEDIFGKGSKGSLIGKIMAIALPLVFAAGVGALGYLTFGPNPSQAPYSGYFIPFLLLAPGVLYVAGVGVERLDRGRRHKKRSNSTPTTPKSPQIPKPSPVRPEGVDPKKKMKMS